MIYLVFVALLAAWVAKVAEAHGRFVVGWTVVALTVGVLATMAGEVLVDLATALLTSSASADRFEVLVMGFAVMRVLLLTGAMAAVVFVLTRLPIKTSSGSVWPVQDVTGSLGGGPGQLSLEPGALRIALSNGSQNLPIAALRGATADGECVRLGWEADGAATELVLMPRGKPDTSPGRRQQSKVIARRVSAHVAGGSVAPLPAARVHVRATPSDRSR